MNKTELEKILSKSGSAFFYTPPQGKARAASYLFNDPAETLTASDYRSFKFISDKSAKLIKSGLTGFILADYEAAYFLEKKLSPLAYKNVDAPVTIFLYKQKNVLSFPSAGLNLFDENNISIYSVRDFHLNTSKREYTEKVKKIRNYIKEGDTYQVNFTVKGKFNFSGDAFSLFSLLLFNQSAPYSAFINLDKSYIFSLSPELFFSLEGNKIITRPMKGTIKRKKFSAEDAQQIELLRNSEKERSENLMIVDLLRNDLGRISDYGSVKTKKLFEVEKYESLYQMISEIHGTVPKGITLDKIIQNIFPCGSVTGAPKLRTMEVIREFEKEPRGIYTGSIGLILKNNKIFNVAIRTLKINKKTGDGEIGLGSGIVWDSKPGEEYDEVVLKSNFLTKPSPIFRLFETMLLYNGKYLFEEEHLSRMQQSADYFLFNFNSKKIISVLRNTALKNPAGEYRVKILLSKQGTAETEIIPLLKVSGEIKITASLKKIRSDNIYHYHKTTNRSFYDNELKEFRSKGFFDVIFFNERNELCEGAVSNIFIRKEKKWFTPEISCGMLPGIYRSFLIQNLPDVTETRLFMDDLINADEVMLVNSVRGKTLADKFYSGDKFITYKKNQESY